MLKTEAKILYLMQKGTIQEIPNSNDSEKIQHFCEERVEKYLQFLA